MTPLRSRPRLLIVIAALVIGLTSRAATSQDLEADSQPDILDLDNSTEAGCGTSSYTQIGFCFLHKAEKADRWLKSIYEGCLRKTDAWTKERDGYLKAWPDVAEQAKQMGAELDQSVSMRRTQDAFERYRSSAAQESRDGAFPGAATAWHSNQTYYELTIQRVPNLYACCGEGAPPKVIDLTRNWCE